MNKLWYLLLLAPTFWIMFSTISSIESISEYNGPKTMVPHNRVGARCFYYQASGLGRFRFCDNTYYITSDWDRLKGIADHRIWY